MGVAVITMALGKELDMWPKDTPSDMKACQLCADSADLLSDSFASKPAERIGKWFAHFEAQLESSGGPFMFGGKLTAADYCVVTSIIMASGKEDQAAELAKCPKLSAYVAEMKNQKGYKAVEAKGLPL